MAEAGSPPQATGQPTKERIVKSESKCNQLQMRGSQLSWFLV